MIKKKGYRRISISFISNILPDEITTTYIPTYMTDTVYIIPTKYIIVDPHHPKKGENNTS